MNKISPQVRFLIDHATITTKLHKQIDLSLSYQGISFTEFLIMHYLYASPQHMMRRTDLADSVGITASGVTRLLAPMEKNRIVEKEKNPRDARQSLVKLTATGQQLYQDSMVGFADFAKHKLKGWTVKQIDMMSELFRGI
ncbi:MAG: MarR family transcriptional regulator [Pseudomonadales bacterium]|nr:MarR family transcriptional regulator [Pseudomonadales bacterium]